jgi:tetratricopeptide (TPR) repeat protein
MTNFSGSCRFQTIKPIVDKAGYPEIFPFEWWRILGGLKMAYLAKLCNGVVVFFAAVLFLIVTNPAFAKTKVFIEEYTYQASEADSKFSCRAIAMEQVKRLLLEKLGTYLESETEVKNFQMTKDRIIMFTGGIVKAEILDEKWDGRTYILKAKLEADPGEVASSVEKLRQDRQKTKELEETRKKADEALKEIEKLKKELEIAKAGQKEIRQYDEAVKRLSATDWFTKGFAYSGDAERAAANYASAERDLKRTKSLYEIAAVTTRMMEQAQAYADVSKAQLEQACQSAIEAYTSAIALDPSYAEAYYNRGLVYEKLGNRRRAIEDHETAAKLGYKPAQEILKSKGTRG